ncbi:hypothetical protein LSAT2_012310, partial [Lamellibrachia satsuma]
MSFQADTVHQHEISSCRTLPRTNFRMKSCLLVIGGLVCAQGKDDVFVEDNHCQYYREDASYWESLTELPQSVGRLYDVCRVDRGLLLTVGSNSGVTVDKGCLLGLAMKKWEAMPTLIIARWYHRSVSLEDSIYVVRGKGVGVSDMPQACCIGAAVTLNDCIYVVGGNRRI